MSSKKNVLPAVKIMCNGYMSFKIYFITSLVFIEVINVPLRKTGLFFFFFAYPLFIKYNRHLIVEILRPQLFFYSYRRDQLEWFCK